MSEFHLPFRPNKQPLPPEQEIAMQYHVPFDWGELYVSGAAHRQYELIPWAPTLKPEQARPTPTSLEKLPLVKVYLLGKDEFQPGERMPDLAFGAKSTLTEDGVELRIAAAVQFNSLADDAATRFENLKQANVFMADEILQRLGIGTEHELTEKIQVDTPQIIAHAITDLTESSLRQIIFDWLRNHEQQKVLRGMTQVGTLATVGSVALGVSTIALTHTPETGLLNSGVFTGFTLYKARSILDAYFKSAREREAFLMSTSAKFANVVSEGVHTTYCRKPFEATTPTEEL